MDYIYREFTLDFFKMDLNSLPKNASSLKFSKFNSNVMGLCLTMHVNLGMSLRKTYIKVRGIKAYIWFIMDAASRSLSWIPHIYGARRWCMHSFDAYGFQTRLQAS